MAFTVINAAGGVPRVIRGTAIPLGTLGAANNAVAFALPVISHTSPNYMVIALSGNLAGGTYVLEASLDGGSTWFVVPAVATDLTVTGVADAAAVAVSRYWIEGLRGGAIFRYGTTAYTSGSSAVWVLFD